MTFESFWELYRDDMQQRLRENTMRTKDYIVELKILPCFGKKKIADITPADIRRWQNSIMKEGGYSPTYLKTINNQLSAIFNYAVKYYDLSKNPCTAAGSMGKGKAEEMNYWTQEEFEDFLEFVKDKPQSRYAFQVLYWTGCRIGELLALTLGDFNPSEKTLNINKSYQRIKGKDVITEPKTAKSKRIITLPDFLVDELNEYVEKLYGMMPSDRLFMVTKSYLEHEIIRGCELSGVKKIRLHDLRHSHASLLISKLGAQPNLVAERLGHEKIQTTLSTYAHLYPNQNKELADKLNELVDDKDDDENEEGGEYNAKSS
jgi:integrase